MFVSYLCRGVLGIQINVNELFSGLCIDYDSAAHSLIKYCMVKQLYLSTVKFHFYLILRLVDYYDHPL